MRYNTILYKPMNNIWRVNKFKKTYDRSPRQSQTEFYQAALEAQVIEKNEFDALLKYEQLKHEVIMTDDFPFNEFAKKGA